MVAAALEAEVAACIEAYVDQLDQRSWRVVVRNGRHQPRQVLISSGGIEVVEAQYLVDLGRLAASRRQDRRGEPPAFPGGVVGALVVDPRVSRWSG